MVIEKKVFFSKENNKKGATIPDKHLHHYPGVYILVVYIHVLLNVPAVDCVDFPATVGEDGVLRLSSICFI